MPLTLNFIKAAIASNQAPHSVHFTNLPHSTTEAQMFTYHQIPHEFIGTESPDIAYSPSCYQVTPQLETVLSAHFPLRLVSAANSLAIELHRRNIPSKEKHEEEGCLKETTWSKCHRGTQKISTLSQTPFFGTKSFPFK